MDKAMESQVGLTNGSNMDFERGIRFFNDESAASANRIRSVLIRLACLGFCVSSIVGFSSNSRSSNAQDMPKQRNFSFEYGASVIGLKKEDKVQIWIPIAQSNRFQKVKIQSTTLPGEAKLTTEPKYGNKMYYLQQDYSGSGNVAFRIKYSVARKEASSVIDQPSSEQDELDLFLKPNQLVPVEGKPVAAFEKFLKDKGKSLEGKPLTDGRVLYDFVESHMTYDKSKPGYGNGDSNWACDSQTGNCTDFHSLFISVARAKSMPAQFRIGFPLPANRGAGTIGGYHCWAFFHASDSGWIPVDISEADKDPSMKDYFFGKLNENRIQFTIGRDLVLNPPQKGAPLNYFVYPYVEVNGEPYPKEKIKLEFRYQDQVESRGE